MITAAYPVYPHSLEAVDQLRVQNAVIASVGFHGGLFALYLILHAVAPQNTLMIAEVELLEFEVEKVKDVVAPEDAPALMRVPKSLKDLLRMALPQARPTEPVEVQPQEMEDITPKIDTFKEPVVQRPKLKIDERKLQTQPQIQLKTTVVRQKRTDFSEVQRQQPTAAAALTEMEQAPQIDLAEVGRVAVPSQPTASIRLDPRRVTRLAEIKTAAPRIARAPTRMAPTGGIKLVDSSPIRRGRRMPARDLPIGYSKGGGGISLKAAPVGNRRVGRIPKNLVQKAARTASDLVPTGAGKKKSVEISGPLAQRKVVNYRLPKYPSWARDKGIEAEVVIRFFVSTEGHVRDRLILERTSGYPELDKISMAALKTWLFAALPVDRAQEGDQWGVITFRFRLK